MNNLKIDLDQIPDTFGVYLWKDENEEIIYVGKANNIKKRIQQYLNGSLNSYKTKNMILSAHDVSFIVCSNEKEALILEQEMIKKYRPYYNILLLDDKKYPFINIELKKNKLEIKSCFSFKEGKNSFSFGPLPPGFGAKMIKNFLIRECLFENGLPIKNSNYEYWENKFNFAKENLLLSNKKIINRLKKQMEEAANIEQYEIAAEIRDTINFLTKSNNIKQAININKNDSFDVIDFFTNNEYLLVTIHHFINGTFWLQEEYINEIKINEQEAIIQFINQFYKMRNKVKKIVTNVELKLTDIFFDSKIIIPKRGIFLSVLKNAHDNNVLNLENKILKFSKEEQKFSEIKTFIEKMSNKQNINDFIVIDNSNFKNENITSAIIYYKKFRPFYSNYRKYSLDKDELDRLSDVEYLKKGVQKYFSNKENEIPDLIIVDGGKAQINEVKQTIKKLKIDIVIIGLVKDDNHKTECIINYQGDKVAIQNKEIYNFFAKIQIEVDKYAKNYHRKKFLQKSLEGFLSTIDGIGPSTEKKLLAHFKTYSNIINANEEKLKQVVSEKQAKKIIEKIEKME